MKFKFCVACGTADDLQHHQFIEGGGNAESNLIALCPACWPKFEEWRETLAATELPDTRLQ